MVKTWCNSKELKRESRNTRYFEKAITQSFSQKYGQAKTGLLIF